MMFRNLLTSIDESEIGDGSVTASAGIVEDMWFQRFKGFLTIFRDVTLRDSYTVQQLLPRGTFLPSDSRSPNLLD